MTPTWKSEVPPPRHDISLLGWLLCFLRLVPLLFLLTVGLILSLFLRLIEAPLFSPNRPITSRITQVVCQIALRIMGIRVHTTGQAMREPGLSVANHSSWLDIFALNANRPLYFVSKGEVAAWPGIGWLARATGTVFIRRARKEAAQQVEMMRGRLLNGHHLLMFPEGTSTDGQRILPFKSTLFATLSGMKDRSSLSIQPVTLQYHAPKGRDARFYGWWGDMDFGPHLLSILSVARHGWIDVTYHTPIKLADDLDRKALAQIAHTAVSNGFISS